MVAGAGALIDADGGQLDRALWSEVFMDPKTGRWTEYEVCVTQDPFSSKSRRHANFGLVTTRVQLDGGGLEQHSTSELSWDPSGSGDYWGTAYFTIGAPAIKAASAAATDASAAQLYDAYYCQSAGFAAINEVKLKHGNQEVIKAPKRALYHWYQMYWPEAKADMDQNVHRYQTESQLKDASGTNQLWTVPILLSCFRSHRPDRALPLHRTYGQRVTLTMKMEALTAFTVNQPSLGIVPNLWGQTNTPLASANIHVRLYGTFYVMGEMLRSKTDSASPNKLIVRQVNEKSVSSPATQAADSLISIEPNFNHPVSHAILGYIPDSYTANNGTLYSPCGVGTKNYFDYSATHGGESLYEISLKFNNQEVINKDLPPVLLRSQLWQENFGQCPYSVLYLIPFSRNLLNDNVLHTVNFSGVEKLIFSAKKNQAAAGTCFLLVENYNVLSGSRGYLGSVFGG